MSSFRKVLFAPLLALLSLLPLVSIQPETSVYAQGAESECWAVIVGIADYQYIDDLSYSDDNAQDLFNQLTPIWGEDHIKLLVDSEAAKANIHDAIYNWLDPREDADDVVLFFFSGHGGEYLGDYYLAPYDALTDPYANDIRDEELASWLDTMDSNKIVVILETCYAGGFISDLSASGRVILASSDANESSWESRALGHGVFSYYILKGFDDFELVDADGDYEISAEEIFYYVEPKVVAYEEAFGEDQHPQLYDGYVGQLGLFCQATFDASPDVISLTIDGTTYSAGELPITFLWLPGSVHDCDALSLVSGGTGTQYVFTSWSDGNASPSRTISQGGEYAANYVTQYYLTVESDYGNPRGKGWYNSGSTATVSVTSPLGAIVRQVFTGWSGDLTETTSTAAILMDRPKTVTANWRNDYLQLYILIGGIVVVVGAVSASVILIRRRRAPR